MTTIAWDGKTMATDSRASRAGVVLDKAQKIFRLPDGSLFAGSGDYSEVMMAKEWLAGDRQEGKKPELEEVHAMLVHPTGQIYVLEHHLVLLPIDHAFWAVGSGCAYALAAMHLGFNAETAVETAMAYDQWTGGKLQVARL